jgi:hypothetical protein
MTFRPPSRVLACPSLVPFSRFPHALVVAHRLFPRHLFTRTDRSSFAVLRYGENSGDSMHAEAHFRTSCHYQMLFLTPLFSKQRLKRKDFPEIVRLTWAQEAPGSNPGAPTKTSRAFSLVYQKPCSPKPSLWNSPRQEVWIRKSFNFRDFVAR